MSGNLYWNIRDAVLIWLSKVQLPKKLKERLIVIPIIFVVSLNAACTNTTARFHPELDSKLSTLDSVLIISYGAKYYSELGEIPKNLEEEANSLNLEMISRATEALKEKGYRKVFVLNSAENSPMLEGEVLSRIVDKYRIASRQLNVGYAISKDRASQTVISLGNELSEFCEKENIDSVLIVSFTGQENSAGKTAFEEGFNTLGKILSGSNERLYNSPSSVLEAALIDGKTAEVLWMDRQSESLSKYWIIKFFNAIPGKIAIN